MLAAFVLLVSLALHVSIAQTLEDDAFIHWRVAGNFLQYGVAAFNVDDPIPSSSSPLWIVVLISVRSIYQSASLQTVLLINVLITSGAVMACVRLYEDQAGKFSIRWLRPLFAITALSALLPASLSGMETPLGIFFFACGALRYGATPGWGVALFCLAIATRLELALPALAWIYVRRGAWRKTDLVPAILGPMIIGSIPMTLFGTLRPGPATAKAIVYDVRINDGIKLALYSTYGELVTKTIIPAVVLSIAAWLLLRVWRSKPLGETDTPSWRTPGSLITSGAAVAAAYLITGVPVFPWYTPIALLPLLIGIFLLANSDHRWRFPAVVLALPSLVVLAQLFASACGHRQWYPLGASALRVSRYQTIGRVLSADCPNALLIAPEIGGLGDAFQHSFVDAIGLASSNVLKYHPLKVPDDRGAGFIGGVPSALVSARNPDVIVGLPTMLHSVAQSPEAARYDRVACPTGIDGGIWGNASFDIYVRKDGTCQISGICEAILLDPDPESLLRSP